MTAAGGLARAGVIVSGAFLVSRILGWVRLVVFAQLFDAAQLDPFFAAFRIPDLIFQLVAGGSAVVGADPDRGEPPRTRRRGHAWRVVSTVINLMLIALATLAAVLFVLAPAVMRVIAPGFEGDAARADDRPDPDHAAQPDLPGDGGRGDQRAQRRRTVRRVGGRAERLQPGDHRRGAVPGADLRGGGPRRSESWPDRWATCSSRSSPLRRLGFRYEPRIDRDDPEARRALLLMAPRAFGLGAGQVTFIVVTALASTVSLGAVTDFNYAFILLQIPIGVIGVPLGIVLLPSLSRDAAVGRETEFAALLTRALRLLLFAMIPIAALAAVLRREFVELLVRRWSTGRRRTSS